MERGNLHMATSWDMLQELEPSPIDSPDIEIEFEKANAGFVKGGIGSGKDTIDNDAAVGTRSPPSHTLGLSGLGGQHGAVYYLTRLQKYSTYAFSVFLPLHLATTSILPLITRSVDSSETFLLLVRPYYQSPVLEPLIIWGPLTVHILSGLALRVHRRNANLRRYGAAHLTVSERLRRGLRVWPGFNWAQGTGWALMGLLGGHMLINRLVPLWHDGGSSGVGLAYAAHGFARHSIFAWAGNAALIGVSAAHIVWGWARWLGYLGPRDQKAQKRRRWVINGLSAALALVWAAGGLGVVARGGAATGWVARNFDALYEKIPLVGAYM